MLNTLAPGLGGLDFLAGFGDVTLDDGIEGDWRFEVVLSLRLPGVTGLSEFSWCRANDLAISFPTKFRLAPLTEE